MHKAWKEEEFMLRTKNIFNTFFMLDKNMKKMNEIFALPFLESVNESSFALDHFNNLQVYNGAEYSLNFSRGFSTGLLNVNP